MKTGTKKANRNQRRGIIAGAVPAAKPPLKWAGGKRWLVPHLREIWKSHKKRRLVEPLCGGLAVPLGLMPTKALLNDINPHLINFYRQLKKGLKIRISLRNDAKVFHTHRKRLNHLIAEEKWKSPEAAGLFYYLNRTGYNGLCRFNQRGQFNVPFGKYKQINYVTDFSQYRGVFAHWEFINSDFESVKLDPDDFVYADPPYDVEFTQYSKEGFNWEDQERLAVWLARHPGPVTLSNQATGRIVQLYKGLGFELRYFEAPRMISCKGDRTPAKEVLAVKSI